MNKKIKIYTAATGFILGFLFLIWGHSLAKIETFSHFFNSFNEFPHNTFSILLLDFLPFLLLAAGYFIGRYFERKNESLVHHSENQYHVFYSIIKNLPDMVFLKDADTLKFVHLNEAGEKLLGLKAADILGKNDYDFFPKEQADFFIEKDRSVLASKKPFIIAEEKIQTASGEKILKTKKTVILDVHHKPLYLLGISEDITAKLEIERSLEVEKAKSIHSAKLATIGELTAGIAHEINNPLSIIVGTISILESQTKENNKSLQQSFERITKSAHRIIKIVSGLKKFSRITENKEYKKNDLYLIIQEVLVIMESKIKKNNVRVDLIVEPHFYILCDEIEIEQVILNLINNAIDAAKNTKENWIRIELKRENSKNILRVIDSGLGIASEIKDKIFIPFFTTKKTGEGTGLGLSICKGILDVHEASIEIKNINGNTCFEVQFNDINTKQDTKKMTGT